MKAEQLIPCKLEYSYKSFMGGNDIFVYAYSLETVVAEKLETLLVDLSSMEG